jgi:hypothetical protein
MNSESIPNGSMSERASAVKLEEQLLKTQSDLDMSNQAVRELAKQRRQSIGLFRGTGYVLLLITIILYGNALIPFAPMNPAWQLSLMGTWVQNMAFPILGFTLVFYGGTEGRLRREGGLVKFLSFAALLVALLFFLMLPVGLHATVRTYNQGKSQLDRGLDQQLGVLREVETQMAAASSNDQIIALMRKMQGQAPQPMTIPDPQTAKKEFLGQLTRARTDLRNNIAQQEQQQRFGLIKGFVQQALLVVVTVAMFVRLWWISRWARVGF